MTSFKLTGKYLLTSLAAVLFTFFFHELAHWFAGECLGYKMILTLNGALPSAGQFLHRKHATFISAAGPLFTILQAIVVYILMSNRENVLLYPFLFAPLCMRIFAGAMNVVNLNDEGKISKSFGIGTYTLPIIICALLLLMVINISKQKRYTAKFQLINIMLVIAFLSIIILTDQLFHIAILD